MTKFHFQALLSLRLQKLTLLFPLKILKNTSTRHMAKGGERGITPKLHNMFFDENEMLVVDLPERICGFEALRAWDHLRLTLNLKKKYFWSRSTGLITKKQDSLDHDYKVVLGREKCLARNLINLAPTRQLNLVGLLWVVFERRRYWHNLELRNLSLEIGNIRGLT